jgi:hypothetical protein
MGDGVAAGVEAVGYPGWHAIIGIEGCRLEQSAHDTPYGTAAPFLGDSSSSCLFYEGERKGRLQFKQIVHLSLVAARPTHYSSCSLVEGSSVLPHEPYP